MYISLPAVLFCAAFLFLEGRPWKRDGFESAIMALAGDVSIVTPTQVGEFCLFRGVGSSREVEIKAHLGLFLFLSS